MCDEDDDGDEHYKKGGGESFRIPLDHGLIRSLHGLHHVQVSAVSSGRSSDS